MENDSGKGWKGKKKYQKILLTITTVYGILYLALILSLILLENPKFELNLEGIIVTFAFIVFLIGYYYSWKNQFVAGIIFIFWWGIMWYLALFVAETDKGAGVVMGFPLFIVAILFIVFWYRNRVKINSN